MSRTLNDWFNEYSASHVNETNQAIHCIAVPVIVWTIVGLFWSLPWPVMGNASLVVFAVLAIFYIRYSLLLTIAVMVLTGVGAYFCYLLESSGISVLWVSVLVFIIAWIAQFVGHNIEGKKPSFLKDLQFLLVGPGWVLTKLLRKCGLNVLV